MEDSEVGNGKKKRFSGINTQIYFLTVQYDKNGGKCGVCGDNYADEQPRPHEAGGKFGLGIIGKRYVMGQVSLSSANNPDLFQYPAFR